MVEAHSGGDATRQREAQNTDMFESYTRSHTSLGNLVNHCLGKISTNIK